MKLKDPAMLIFPAEFLLETSFMTDKEVGKYIKLLCELHHHGHLSKEKILRICEEQNKEIFDCLAVDEDGLYYHPRMEYEAQKRSKYRESRADNARSKATKLGKNEEKTEEEKKNYGEFNNVMLTDAEYEALREKFPSSYASRIKRMSYYLKSTGATYDNHYATLLSWDMKEDERREKMGSSFSSYDVDDFFNAALERSTRELEREIAENKRRSASSEM